MESITVFCSTLREFRCLDLKQNYGHVNIYIQIHKHQAATSPKLSHWYYSEIWRWIEILKHLSHSECFEVKLWRSGLVFSPELWRNPSWGLCTSVHNSNSVFGLFSAYVSMFNTKDCNIQALSSTSDMWPPDSFALSFTPPHPVLLLLFHWKHCVPWHEQTCLAIFPVNRESDSPLCKAQRTSWPPLSVTQNLWDNKPWWWLWVTF